MNIDENTNIELKRELVESINREIIAFLNTSGGTLLVGVNNDKTVYKPFLLIDKNEIELKLCNIIENTIRPSTFGLISHFFTKEGFLIINVEKGTRKPYYLKEKGPRPIGVFKRVGSSVMHANEEEIIEMIVESKKYIYESDFSCEENLTFKYLNNIFSEKEITFTNRDKITLGIKKNNKFTNLGFLLSDQSNLIVKMAEYDENMNFKMKREFKGPILKILENVEEQVEKLNTLSVVINGDSFKRKEIKSYPSVSLREMIINAFCHCDYSKKSNIKIEFFPNQVKITSPGGIFGATLEEVFHGVQTYRNPRLINILDKLGYIENYGTGIQRTILSYKEYRVKPSFNASDNFFIVVLPNLNYIKKIRKKEKLNDQIKPVDQINDQINDQIEIDEPLSDLSQDILFVIYTHPGIKVSRIVELLLYKYSNLNSDKVRNHIKRHLYKYIEYRGSNKTGGYFTKIKIF